MNDIADPSRSAWDLDPARSELRFVARRMGMTVRGRFAALDGRLDIDPDRLEASHAFVTVATASIEPAMPALRGLLLSDSFLAAEEHPTLTFRSTAITADVDRFSVQGELTFRGETRTITLQARLAGIDTSGAVRSAVIEARGRADHLMADEELEVELSLVAVPAAAGSRTRAATAGVAGSVAGRGTVPIASAARLSPSSGDRPLHLVALVGSLRRGSLNRSLLRAAQAVAPDGVTIEAFPLADVPFYDGDLEADGDPASVRALKNAIREADGIVIVTPEYNRGLPAVIKNAIDWASRPPFDSVLVGRPVLLMGASTGRSATKHALQQAADALDHAQARPFERRFGVARAGDLVDEDHRLSDAQTLDALRGVLHDFRRFVQTADATHAAAA